MKIDIRYSGAVVDQKDQKDKGKFVSGSERVEWFEFESTDRGLKPKVEAALHASKVTARKEVNVELVVPQFSVKYRHQPDMAALQPDSNPDRNSAATHYINAVLLGSRMSGVMREVLCKNCVL